MVSWICEPAHFSLYRKGTLPKAISVSEMQAIDTIAIEQLGIPRLLLMEHAGLAVARSALHLINPARSQQKHPSSILICCGSGYNGGDGLCAARHLHDWGYSLRIVVIGRINQLREEPAVYARILQRLGVLLLECASVDEMPIIERELATCHLVIDALLGIGLKGAVREPTASCIHSLNRSGKPILAVDIPSGLDGDTGSAQGLAVQATRTVTFGLPKQGCLLGEGVSHTGDLVVDAITIPRRLLTNGSY